MGLAPGHEGIPAIGWLNAPDVVREGLRDAARGKPVSIPSLRYKAVVALTKILPPSLTARAARRGRV
jgi:short-subunit dehydrogenase